jgi:hypothetical protein
MRQMPQNIAFSEHDHALVGSVEFPHDEIFDRLDGTPPPAAPPTEMAGDGLREILAWSWSSPSGKTTDIHGAFVKFLALSATMRPELFDGQTYKELGEQVGCTRANISKAAVRFAEHFGGLHFRRQHNGRDNMRAARVRSYQKQKHDEPTNPNIPA